MKVRSGFLLALDEHTKKMIPFFVKVRSKDIVPTDPVKIEEVLQPTSQRWTLQKMLDRVDMTTYVYSTEWSSSDDPNGESYYNMSENVKGELTYSLFKDGRMEVDGVIISSSIEDFFTSSTGCATYISYLPMPFAIPNVKNSIYRRFPVETNYAYGNCPDFYPAGIIHGKQITNFVLNPEQSNKTYYNFLLQISKVVVKPETHSKMTDKFNAYIVRAEGADEFEDLAANDMLRYVSTYAPIKIHYSGYWKSDE